MTPFVRNFPAPDLITGGQRLDINSGFRGLAGMWGRGRSGPEE